MHHTSGDVMRDTPFGCACRAGPRGKVRDPLENDVMTAQLAEVLTIPVNELMPPKQLRR